MMPTTTMQDWTIIRRHDGAPVISFDSRPAATAHYRRIGCPEALRVARRETTIRLVPEYVRPLPPAKPDPLAIPDIPDAVVIQRAHEAAHPVGLVDQLRHVWREMAALKGGAA